MNKWLILLFVLFSWIALEIAKSLIGWFTARAADKFKRKILRATP